MGGRGATEAKEEVLAIERPVEEAKQNYKFPPQRHLLIYKDVSCPCVSMKAPPSSS